MSDSESFYNRLRVRGLLDAYFDGMIEYAYSLGEFYNLTDEQMKGVVNMTVNAKLSQLSKMWKKVEPTAPSFSQIADGDYVGELKEMKLGEAKKTGRLQVVSTYEIADGDYTGQTTKRFDGLDNETSMGYFKGYCEIIGLELPDDLELLQETMDEFVANNTDLFNLTVKTNDKYANVYVNGVSEFVKGEEGEGTEETVEEEPVEEGVEEDVEEIVEEEQVEEQQVAPPKKAVKMVAKVAQPIKKTVVVPPKKITAIKKK